MAPLMLGRLAMSRAGWGAAGWCLKGRGCRVNVRSCMAQNVPCKSSRPIDDWLGNSLSLGLGKGEVLPAAAEWQACQGSRAASVPCRGG